MPIIIFIVSLILATGIVNSSYRKFMKIFDISVMAFSIRKKIVLIAILTFFIAGLIGYIFGYGTY